jgi:hypothetical protein
MFINTKQFSPVIIDSITGAHPKSLEYREWWFEQKRRCLEGYSVGGIKITGDHYWYLNFWKIKGVNQVTGRKDLIAPRFIDMDYEFFNVLEQARKEGKNLCVLKRRQVGFSEKLSAVVGKEFSLFNNSQSIIVAGEDRYSLATMRMVMRGLNSLKDTEFYKRKTPQTEDYIQGKYKVLEDGVPVWKGSMSEIYQMTAKNNPQVTVGKTPSFIMFEEAGKFPGIKAAYKYVQPALETNFIKTGIAVMIGTGGDMDKGADELEEIFYSPEAWDMLGFSPEGDEEQDTLRKTCYFVPAWKFASIDDEGNSLKEQSLEQIHKVREQNRKAKDPKAYINYLTQMPLNPDEAFMRTGGNRFNTQKLNERLAFLRKHRELDDIIQRGRLEWIREEKSTKIIGVEWIPDCNGQYRILEHPLKDSNENVLMNLYKGSTDSYDKDNASSSSSKLSCQIFKGFKDSDTTSRIFVARYTERPKTAEEAYEATAKLCMYYMAPNLIEWSNIGIFGWYERNGFGHFLRERPRIAYANVKESRVNNRFGIDPSTKEYWITSYRDYIETNVDNLYDQEQIIAAINYRDDKDYNCDVTISSSLCIVHELDDRQLKVKEKTTEHTEFFHYSTGKNGKMKQGFMKVA